MPITVPRGDTDTILELIRGGLERYQQFHPLAEITLHRQDAVSVSIRIIDPEFQGVARSARHAMVWDSLEGLPDEVQADISMLVLETSEEIETSAANLEFENASRSVS